MGGMECILEIRHSVYNKVVISLMLFERTIQKSLGFFIVSHTEYGIFTVSVTINES